MRGNRSHRRGTSVAVLAAGTACALAALLGPPAAASAPSAPRPATPPTPLTGPRPGTAPATAGAAASAPATPAVVARAVAGPTLTVDLGAGRHPISSGIYGISDVPAATARAAGATLDRWGGNSRSRYNYTNDTYNTGSDWYFENIVAGPGERLTDRVAVDRAAHLTSIVNVPMIGWVSKASPVRHPFACAFPTSLFPAQDSVDPWDPACGNGQRGGVPLRPAGPTRTSLAAGPSFDRAMVASLVDRYGDRRARRRRALQARQRAGAVELDPPRRAPAARSATTSSRHAAPRTRAAVKAADPTAATLGPVRMGLVRLLLLRAPTRLRHLAPTAPRHGGHDLVRVVPAQMRAYQQRTAGAPPRLPRPALLPAGQRGRAVARRRRRHAGAAAALHPLAVGPELRRRELDRRTQPSSLIPRMRAWVAQHYPGTKLAITEYNCGGLDHSTARWRRPTCSASSAARGSAWPRCGSRRRRASPARSPSACTATTTASATASARRRSCGLDEPGHRRRLRRAAAGRRRAHRRRHQQDRTRTHHPPAPGARRAADHDGAALHLQRREPPPHRQEPERSHHGHCPRGHLPGELRDRAGALHPLTGRSRARLSARPPPGPPGSR